MRSGATAARMVAGAAFRIAGGVMSLQDGSMTSNIYAGGVRGDIDFKSWTMDLSAQLRRQGPATQGADQGGLRLTAEGSIDAPNIKLNNLN